jgi:hypothetical protein
VERLNSRRNNTLIQTDEKCTLGTRKQPTLRFLSALSCPSPSPPCNHSAKEEEVNKAKNIAFCEVNTHKKRNTDKKEAERCKREVTQWERTDTQANQSESVPRWEAARSARPRCAEQSLPQQRKRQQQGWQRKGRARTCPPLRVEQ